MFKHQWERSFENQFLKKNGFQVDEWLKWLVGNQPYFIG